VGLAAPARCRIPHPFHRADWLLGAIDYEAEQGPTISIRVQEMFGLAKHPAMPAGACRSS